VWVDGQRVLVGVDRSLRDFDDARHLVMRPRGQLRRRVLPAAALIEAHERGVRGDIAGAGVERRADRERHDNR